jgi:ribosome-associated protein
MVVVNRNFRTIAKRAAEAADDKKGVDVVVLDVRKESDMTDYMVIAGAHSKAQMRAMDDSVEEALLDRGVRILHREGRSKDRWIALDYGSLVVHILLMEARKFYRLESLWEKAKPVKWTSK